MDNYIVGKCVQNTSLPSLYVVESNLKDLRHQLAKTNIEITQIDDELTKTIDQTGLEVKIVHAKCSDSSNIKSICNTLIEMRLNFAQPWHQSWFKNKPKSNVEVEKLDIFDLIALQIEDHRLAPIISQLIENKLNLEATHKFDLNKYLFDNNRTTVEEEILLHFLYHYGRHHYTEIIWLEDFRGTQLFDECISKMNLKIINLRYIELHLDDYNDVGELFKRLESSKHQFTIKMGTKFSSTRFLELIACETVEEIYLDIGLDLYYSPLDVYKLDDDEFAGRSDNHKFIFIQSITETKSNSVDNFIKYFKRFCNCRREKRYFYLTLDGVLLDDWSLLNGLNILEITFKNVEITDEHLKQLAVCTELRINLKFYDCLNFRDEMLLTFLDSCDWIATLYIKGRSAITNEFFKRYAQKQILLRDLKYYDFREDDITIEVEGFEKYTSLGIFGGDEFFED